MIRTPNHSKANQRRAVTLVELLVVLAILAVLAPMLAASADAVTRPNRERMCAYRLGRMGSAMLQYTIENDEYLPGSPGTSGAQVIYDYINAPPASGPSIIFPSTQTWDWAAPLAPYLAVTLDPSRSKRMEQFGMGHFWCPANDYQSLPFYGGSVGPAAIRMLSFFTTRNFLMYGDAAEIAPELASYARWSSNITSGIDLPGSYHPRLEQLGTAYQKVFLSDGSRFLESSGLITHDIATRPKAGGMFSDGGPTLPSMLLRSYFLNSPLKEYSYRHAHDVTSGLNLVFYDGHISWMSEPASRHPRWWYPTGTAIPWNEMNDPTRLPLFEEIIGDPNLEYHVP